MRFHLDENLSPEIAPFAKDLGLDVADWESAGMAEKLEDEQLAYAAQEVRCIITINTGDFIGLTKLFQRRERPHAGVLLVPWQPRKSESYHFARGLRAFVDDNPTEFVAYEWRWFSKRWIAG